MSEVDKPHSWIGSDHPPGWKRVGTIDVADPADVSWALDQCLKIGRIYDGMTTEELIEAVARQIKAGYRAAQTDDGIARAVISVVAEAMREPTERMCSEGESAASIGIGRANDDEAIRRVYRDMFAASPLGPLINC